MQDICTVTIFENGTETATVLGNNEFPLKIGVVSNRPK